MLGQGVNRGFVTKGMEPSIHEIWEPVLPKSWQADWPTVHGFRVAVDAHWPAIEGQVRGRKPNWRGKSYHWRMGSSIISLRLLTMNAFAISNEGRLGNGQ